ncbi:hypothetical protein [Larkinella soli]|uniref:hypothetical protein n=1 Tax=Larkinella soli TaxID=1770527 RepID=UPI000FFB6284|nr:hypothetical protein [Larkinella soli]
METNIGWKGIPKIKGWDGLNNAAIQTFNSDIVRSFIREMFQNSNDAREFGEGEKKKKLKISLNYRTITSEEIPDFNELIEIIKSTSNAPANKGHEQFFKQALESIQDQNSICVLEYKDYNTVGLSGSDEDNDSTFYACVLAEGLSIKKNTTAGGSYGIGKNSTYGFSKIRTVLYSSLNKEEEFIFQGVAKLASYKKGDTTNEYRVFLGEGTEARSVRDKNKLTQKQKDFLVRDKPGLTQIVLCPMKTEMWIEEFAKTILKNYWQLLSIDELEVELMEEGKVQLFISKDTLEGLLEQYFNNTEFDPAEDTAPKGNPLDYYNCYKKNEPIDAEIYAIGKVKFFYEELDHKKTNHIAFIRNGMVIYSENIHGFSSIKYCGVFLADEEGGNEILRMMEPPTHDHFDPPRLEEKSKEYTKKDGEKILKEIKSLIRKCLNQILERYRTGVEEIPWLNELFNTPNGLSKSTKGHNTGINGINETVSRISSNNVKVLSFSSLSKNSSVTVQGEEESVTKSFISGNKKGSSSNNKTSKNTSRESAKAGSSIIKVRIFKKTTVTNNSHSYIIKFKSQEKIRNKNFLIKQIGDTGEVSSFVITDLIDKNGNKVKFEELKGSRGERNGYKLLNIQIPNELALIVQEPYHSAFSISEK